MLEKIGLLGLAMDKARHAAARQELSAQNVANADTPGYKARDVTAFEAEYKSGFQARQTHSMHMNFSDAGSNWREIEVTGAADPNGNTVSLDQEILRSVDAERAHDRAVTIYKSSLDVLRASLGRR